MDNYPSRTCSNIVITICDIYLQHTWYAYGLDVPYLVFFVLQFLLDSPHEFPMPFRVTALALVKSYGCSSASETTVTWQWPTVDRLIPNRILVKVSATERTKPKHNTHEFFNSLRETFYAFLWICLLHFDILIIIKIHKGRRNPCNLISS